MRVEFDRRNEKLNFKIREAQMQKVPYMIVVGDKEAEAGTASLRLRDGSQKSGLVVGDLVQTIIKDIQGRKLISSMMTEQTQSNATKEANA